jgi:hypothetical protein
MGIIAGLDAVAPAWSQSPVVQSVVTHKTDLHHGKSECRKEIAKK